MQNGVFRNGNCGLYGESVDSTFCKRLFFLNNTNEDRGGIFFQNVIDGEVSNSVFVNNYIGMKIKDRFEGEIFNNYINKNYIGIKILYFLGTIRNNQLEGNQIDINYAYNMEHEEKSIEIISNNLYSNVGIKYFIAPNYIIYYNMNIENNNFKSAEMFIGYYSRYFEENEKIDAANNYFNGFTNIEMIEQFIYDLWDDDLDEIILEPFEILPVPNAGIGN